MSFFPQMRDLQASGQQRCVSLRNKCHHYTRLLMSSQRNSKMPLSNTQFGFLFLSPSQTFIVSYMTFAIRIKYSFSLKKQYIFLGGKNTTVCPTTQVQPQIIKHQYIYLYSFPLCIGLAFRDFFLHSYSNN